MLLTAYYIIAYYGSLALFGAVAVAFNSVCWLSSAVGGSGGHEQFFRRAIQREFSAFVRLLEFLRLLRIDYRGFEKNTAPGRVIVANHPSLLDAVLLISRVPTAVCIFKPAIRRNRMLGQTALRAGYIASDSALELVRSGVAKIGG